MGMVQVRRILTQPVPGSLRRPPALPCCTHRAQGSYPAPCSPNCRQTLARRQTARESHMLHEWYYFNTFPTYCLCQHAQNRITFFFFRTHFIHFSCTLSVFLLAEMSIGDAHFFGQKTIPPLQSPFRRKLAPEMWPELEAGSCLLTLLYSKDRAAVARSLLR